MGFYTYALIVFAILVLLCFLFRRFLLSCCYGNLDYVFFYTTFLPMMKKKHFHKGWGSVERYNELLSLEITPKPKEINHSYVGEQQFSVDKKSKYEYYRQLFKFESPLSKVLRDGEEIAEYSLMTTNKEKSGHTLLIILPAAGQEGYGWRNKQMAIPLMKKSDGKIDCLIPIAACYHTRKSKIQKEMGLSHPTFVDFPCITTSFYEELRMYISHYSEIYENVILTGMSMGGSFAAFICNQHITDRKIKLGSVCALGCMSLDFRTYLFGKIVNYDALKGQKCPFLENPEDYDENNISDKSMADLIMKVTIDTTMKYLEKINEDKKSNHLMSTFLAAEYDKLIRRPMEKELIDVTRLSLKNCNFYDDDEVNEKKRFKKVWLRGGHFTTFVDQTSIRKIRDEVFDMFQRMEKIKR